MRSNDKININNKINNINIYQKYKHEDFFPEINKEENIITNNKYLSYNITNKNNNNKNNNKINKNYDYTFKNKIIEKKRKGRKQYAISDSLKGSFLEKILDLNNKIDIGRSFEDEKNKKVEDSFNNNKNNFIVTFRPINEDNNNNQINFTKSNKGNYESINSNFTLGKNSQNKNILVNNKMINHVRNNYRHYSLFYFRLLFI